MSPDLPETATPDPDDHDKPEPDQDCRSHAADESTPEQPVVQRSGVPLVAQPTSPNRPESDDTSK